MPGDKFWTDGRQCGSWARKRRSRKANRSSPHETELSVIRRLQFERPEIPSPHFHQPPVIAFLRDPAFFQHQNPIRHPHRRKPVRNKQRQLPLRQIRKPLEHFVFRLRIEGRRGLAKHQQLGPSKITPTHDLNAAQVADLARRIGGLQIEAIAYQHLPVFHTEHCVFCRFLSTGTSYLDCCRPCEKHRIELRDQSGRAHGDGRRRLP